MISDDDDEKETCLREKGSTSIYFNDNVIECCSNCGYAFDFTYFFISPSYKLCVKCAKQSNNKRKLELCIDCHYRDNVKRHKCFNGWCTHRQRCVAMNNISGYRCLNRARPNRHNKCGIHWKFNKYIDQVKSDMMNIKQLPEDMIDYILDYIIIIPQQKRKTQSRKLKYKNINGIRSFY